MKFWNLKHGSISCWYSFVILFYLCYSKINKFITTAITFAHLTLAPIWKKIWEACEILNLKHGSIILLVFFCHSFFISVFPRSSKFITTAITFAHLTLASIWKKIWEACEIQNLKHGSIICWYSCCHSFFFLYYSKRNKFLTTAITFADLTIASIWKKIWEACEIQNLKVFRKVDHEVNPWWKASLQRLKILLILRK